LIEHGLTSAPTQYRLYSRWFLQVKRPNQQYQSTEGKSYKGKEPKNTRSQAVARIADRTAKNCRGHVT